MERTWEDWRNYLHVMGRKKIMLSLSFRLRVRRQNKLFSLLGWMGDINNCTCLHYDIYFVDNIIAYEQFYKYFKRCIYMSTIFICFNDFLCKTQNTGLQFLPKILKMIIFYYFAKILKKWKLRMGQKSNVLN